MSNDNNYLDKLFNQLDNHTTGTDGGHDLPENNVSPADYTFGEDEDVEEYTDEHDHVHESIEIGHEPFVMITYDHQPVEEGILITPQTIRIGNMPTEPEAVIAHLQSVIQMLESDDDVRFDPVEAQG